MKKLYTFATTFLLTASCLLPVASFSQPGSLDITFGNGGKVQTAAGVGFGNGSSVVIQSDGKIVVAGQKFNGSNWDFALVRYNSNGTLDDTFGSGGQVTTPNSSGDLGFSVAIQTNGKIVLAGYTANNSNFTLIRYNIDGSLDNTFGSGGIVITSIVSWSNYEISVSIQTDGKILVAGSSLQNCPTSCNSDFTLFRFDSTGTLDNTFGNGGIVYTDFGNQFYDATDRGFSVTVQSDGKILEAGWTDSAIPSSDFALVRYNNDGTLDTTFGTGGKVTTNFGSATGAVICSLAIQTDGRILGAGYSGFGGVGHFALARYNSDGSLDNSFGLGGKTTTVFGSNAGNESDKGYSVAIQTDGKIVMSGMSYNINTGYDFTLVRYNDDGSLDNTFGFGGIVTTDFGDSASDDGRSVAIQTDGKIVVAGYSEHGFDYHSFSVARYNNASPLGINEITTNPLLIVSPNPFTNELSIKGTKEKEDIIIYNLIGEEILKQKASEGETKLNTENVSPGFYLLHYSDLQRTENYKIVKP